ncbi:hypothetical protein [Streptomyces sp. AP-93]|uniref:hypothetical protein n=1 Tax=Streptomyces sp. AP-93 TaxID=2929048 RepID=UPI001FB02EE4|nr:hypothetical protein [Streptomyces sp. AP-93]MCJ0875462.1 hypothetical protein [Streptomyces sp. AP-93]
MTKLFLSLHVLAAVLAIGPVAVAASMFPAALRRVTGESGAGAPGDRPPGDRDALANLRMLHRVCRVYAAVGTAVPVLGFATASSLGVLGSAWLIVSIVLTTAAAAVLALLILPGQDAALVALQEQAGPDAGPGPGPGPDPGARSAARLAMLTGVFNLLWATVTVLMIIRPGSTTGA